MNDRKLTLYACNARHDWVYKYQPMLWSDLCEKLETTTRTPETLAEYKSYSRGRQTEIKDVGGFVLGYLQEGKRSNETMVSRSAIALDLDYAPSDFWDKLWPVFDWACCVYSTHKHTQRTPKYRVIIPLSRDVNPDEYQAIARRIALDFMDLEWVDDSSFQPARMMFWPSTSSDGEYEYHVQRGEFIDPDFVLNRYELDWHDQSTWAYSSRVIAKQAKERAAKQADPRDKEGPIGCFCRAYTIQEAIETFIPDVYEMSDQDNRWTYKAGTSAKGLVIYDSALAYSNHSTDPANDEHCHNAFDLVRIHKFRGLDEKSKAHGKSLPSERAMLELVYNDEHTQKQMASDLFGQRLEKMQKSLKQEEKESKKEENGTEKAKKEPKTVFFDPESYEKENAQWQGLLIKNPKNGKLEESYENVQIVVENDTNLKGFGRYNAFKDIAEKTASLPWWEWNPYEIEWSDADTNELYIYLEKYYGLSRQGKIKVARDAKHMREKYHPVLEYLDNLPDWDGVERLDTLLIRYLNAADTEYVRAVTRKAIVAAIARVKEPGIKFDYVLTLAGDQGLKKSSLFRELMPHPEWFSDSIESLQGKEAYEAVQGSWIIELAELSAVKRTDIERTKQFITKQSDRFRKAYAEKTGEYKRQCIFVATTNSTDFLADMSGNRRWWIVPVKKGAGLDVFTDLGAERDQIFAEALYRYRQGERLYLPEELEAKAFEIQEDYTYRSVKFDSIEEFLELDLPENWNSWDLTTRRVWLKERDIPGVRKRDLVCLLEIHQELFDGTEANFIKSDQREMSDILHKLGWERTKSMVQTHSFYGKRRCYLRPKED